MPYRDPARRAAWMREYRKRKRQARLNEPADRPPSPSAEGARERLTSAPKSDPRTQGSDHKSKVRIAVNGLKTALELAPPFPLGALASQVCPYCLNSGYSS